MNIQKFNDICLNEFFSFSDTENRWVDEVRSRMNFPGKNLTLIDLNYPYEAFLPYIYNFSQGNGTLNSAHQTFPKIVPYSQFVEQVDNVFALYDMYPDLASRNPLFSIVINFLKERAKDYIDIFDRMLFKQNVDGPKDLDLGRIQIWIEEYKKQAKKSVDILLNKALTDGVEPRYYAPGGPKQAYRKKSTTGPVLDPSNRLPLCSHHTKSREYGVPNLRTYSTIPHTVSFSPYYGISEKLLFDTSYRDLPTSLGNLLETVGQKITPNSYINIAPPANVDKFIPNPFLWAHQEGLGKISACVSIILIEDSTKKIRLAHGAMKYSLYYRIGIRFFYTPYVGFSQSRGTDDPKRAEIANYEVHDRIDVSGHKIGIGAFLHYISGFSNLLWEGGTINKETSPNGRDYFCKDSRASWCNLNVIGIKNRFHTMATSKSDFSHQTNFKKRVLEIDNFLRNRYQVFNPLSLNDFKGKTELDFNHMNIPGMHPSDYELIRDTDRVLDYLKALTLISLYSEYEASFSTHFDGDLMPQHGIDIFNNLFVYGESKESLYLKIDARASDLLKTYTTLANDKERLSKVIGMSELVRLKLSEIEAYKIHFEENSKP